MATQQAKTRLAQYTPQPGVDKTCDVLLAMIDHAPFPAGQQNMVNDVNSCQSDDALRQLGARYINGLFIPMRAKGGKTPAVTDHPSETSPQNEQVINELNMEPAVRTQTYLKRLTLARDNYRCQVSGMLNKKSVIKGIIGRSASEGVVTTIAAHIIPFSAVPSLTASEDQIQKSAAIFEVLSRFGGLNMDELNGPNINRLENVMTLGAEIHMDFGALDSWLEAVPNQLNTYAYKKAYDYLDGPVDGTHITFTSTQTWLRLPSPQYLAIHAACAKVVHMAAMAEIIDKILDDREDICVLAMDGSSHDLIHTLLEVAAHSVSVH